MQWSFLQPPHLLSTYYYVLDVVPRADSQQRYAFSILPQLLAFYRGRHWFRDSQTSQCCKAGRWCQVDPKSRWNISIKMEPPFETDDVLRVLKKHTANELSIETCLWIIFKCFPELLVSSTRSELVGNSYSTLHFHVESSNTQWYKPAGKRTPCSKVSLSAEGGAGWNREGGNGDWFRSQAFG